MKVSFMEIAASPQENQLKKYFNLSGFRRGQKRDHRFGDGWP
ncbi:hypothetical protein [Bdellovibrio bacteriovorus]